MKYLLAAINAKYIHSNLGIYSLKRYAEQKLCLSAADQEGVQSGSRIRIELGEYTINHQMERILWDIYRRNPDVVGFSCYIWNILFVKELVRDLKKVMPEVRIWLGGPEVSYDAEQVLLELPEAELVMLGEGEETFRQLIELAEKEKTEMKGADRSQIRGITYRDADGQISSTGTADLMKLDELPFSYENLDGLEHRILYYESSRGCPFSCSYCLSSIDKRVRFRSLSLVKQELLFFLEKKVPQVKFVDRTFNCKKSHSMEIWRFLLEHDNGVTNFHFEISADLLDEEELELIRQMRPGLIQLEIGVQTTHAETIREIRRHMELNRLSANVASINRNRNVHQHLDLIAGLPFETLSCFRRSFDEVYRMEPEQLQLGFLKVLKGSAMAEKAEEYGLVYQSQPPYEVLSTRWLSYGDLILLKGVEEMTEVYYNSGQFRKTLTMLEAEFASPFSLYEELFHYYEKMELRGRNHNRLARYEILYAFIWERKKIALDREKKQSAEGELMVSEQKGESDSSAERSRKAELACMEPYRDVLMYDLYLRENVKSRPDFARELSTVKETVKQFFIREAANPRYLKGYEGYDSKQLAKMAHLEPMADGSYVLFDYKNRDALLGNAKAIQLSAQILEELSQ